MSRKRTLPTTKSHRKDRRGYRAEVRAYDPNYYHKSQLKTLYKLSYDEWQRMLIEQNGVCILCNEPNQKGRRLCVDHDHNTGRVRGLLCSRCNITIGRHKPAWYAKALCYLLNCKVPKMEGGI